MSFISLLKVLFLLYTVVYLLLFMTAIKYVFI